MEDAAAAKNPEMNKLKQDNKRQSTLGLASQPRGIMVVMNKSADCALILHNGSILNSNSQEKNPAKVPNFGNSWSNA